MGLNCTGVVARVGDARVNVAVLKEQGNVLGFCVEVGERVKANSPDGDEVSFGTDELGQVLAVVGTASRDNDTRPFIKPNLLLRCNPAMI
jgi:hypothetical protein